MHLNLFEDLKSLVFIEKYLKLPRLKRHSRRNTLPSLGIKFKPLQIYIGIKVRISNDYRIRRIGYNCHCGISNRTIKMILLN